MNHSQVVRNPLSRSTSQVSLLEFGSSPGLVPVADHSEFPLKGAGVGVNSATFKASELELSCFIDGASSYVFMYIYVTYVYLCIHTREQQGAKMLCCLPGPAWKDIFKLLLHNCEVSLPLLITYII